MTTTGGGYVVTGATGGLGGRVARRLAERGVGQRVVVRDPWRAPELAGAEVAVGNYHDRDQLRRAFEGAHTTRNTLGFAFRAGCGRVA